MENKIIYSISLSIRAQKDLQKSFNWYEDQKVGLGSRFTKEAADLFRTIKQNPKLFSIKDKFYREVGMSSFPFLVIYRINRKHAIRIVSVFHTSQNPKKKYRQAQ